MLNTVLQFLTMRNKNGRDQTEENMPQPKATMPKRAKGKTYLGLWIDQDVADKARAIVKAERSTISQFCRTALVQAVNLRKTSAA